MDEYIYSIIGKFLYIYDRAKIMRQLESASRRSTQYYNDIEIIKKLYDNNHLPVTFVCILCKYGDMQLAQLMLSRHRNTMITTITYGFDSAIVANNTDLAVWAYDLSKTIEPMRQKMTILYKLNECIKHKQLEYFCRIVNIFKDKANIFSAGMVLIVKLMMPSTPLQFFIAMDEQHNIVTMYGHRTVLSSSANMARTDIREYIIKKYGHVY